MNPLVVPGAPVQELRFEVVYPGTLVDDQPTVYGVVVPRGWPIGTSFRKDAPRFWVPVNAVRFNANVGEADRLTIVALCTQVKLAGVGLVGGEEAPVELRGGGVFPQLEVDQDGEPRRDVVSASWAWHAHDRGHAHNHEPEFLLGIEKGAAGDGAG